jgi:sugar lactone lactonase YvrE
MRLTYLTLCVLVASGCGDNGGDSTGSSGGSSTGTTTEPTTGTTTADDSTSTGETPTTGTPTTGSTTDPTTGSTTDPTTDSTTDPTTDSTTDPSTGTTEGTTGDPIDCRAIVRGPVTPELFVSGYDGSEDLAFDGKGGLALKQDDKIMIVRADKSETMLAEQIPVAYGSRFIADGRLLVALPQDGKVIAVDPRGAVSDFVGGVLGANGIYADTAGDVWLTEFGGSKLIRIKPDMSEETIVMGPDAVSANGVVFDPQRGLVFYTNYQLGIVRSVAIDGQGEPAAPQLVTTIPASAPDGLTLDACGNLYVVDQGNSRLFRVLLDGEGAAIGEAEALADFPSNVANAQFGVGEGFDDHTLYVAGNPGDVYMVVVEFPGAPIATVQ